MTFLQKVAGQFERHGIPYAIVGGHAVAMHGAVRGTVDLDFIINWSLTNLKLAQSALEEIGLRSRLPITPEELFHFREEFIKSKNLIAWNFTNPEDSRETVDIITTFHLEEGMAEPFILGDTTIHVLAKKHLIAMKRASAREQDLLDIKILEQLP